MNNENISNSTAKKALNVATRNFTDASCLPVTLLVKLNQYSPQNVQVPSHEGYPTPTSSSISKNQWTTQEDNLVYKLHNQYGNKWAIIAEHLKGRTDNCIKNHFYSRLRKGLKKINKIIEDQYQLNYKEFKIIDLYKVIQASDQKFKEFHASLNEMTDLGHDLKNKLFLLAQEEPDGTQQFDTKVKRILQDFSEFTNNYKRKSKKCRRYSPMGQGSIYRNSSKKLIQTNETDQHENEKSQKQISIEEKQICQKNSQTKKSIEPLQKKIRQKKQTSKNLLVSNQLNLVHQTNQQTPTANRMTEENNLNQSQKKNTYRKFSDDEGQEKDEEEDEKEQRLNHFAQNILKTFKSYYSFKSFKSHEGLDQPFFQ